jgi:hypothetical protein
VNSQYEFLMGSVLSVLFFLSGWQDRGMGPGSRYVGLFSQSIAVLVGVSFCFYAIKQRMLGGAIVLLLLCLAELWFMKRTYWHTEN